MTDRNDLFRRMREALAQVFSESGRARLPALDVGLDLTRIDLSGPPVVFWQSILQEAERQGKIQSLLLRAFADAPARAELVALSDEYQRWRKEARHAQETPAERAAPATPKDPLNEWDVFISHAWEDKEAIARPLAKALEARGLRVWFDEFTLSVGDRLRRSIDKGLVLPVRDCDP